MFRDDNKDGIDFFLKQEYSKKFKAIEQKTSLIKVAKFEFPSFEVDNHKIKTAIETLVKFKVSKIASVNYGTHKIKKTNTSDQYQDQEETRQLEGEMQDHIYQFRWNSTDVYKFDN